MKSVVAIRHVHFEDLGLFEPVLTKAGYAIQYIDVDRDDLRHMDVLAPDLVVVLGAPIGVYEERAYPFLSVERKLLASRLSQHLPTLGICLGAQQLAATLGATVAPGGFKEIGFAPVQLTQMDRKERCDILKPYLCSIGTEMFSNSLKGRSDLHLRTSVLIRPSRWH
jgi:GMP synthase (glutamine-hydrolysing)